MNPSEHGEVFVTEDGAETDLDLGHYERFIDENLNKFDKGTVISLGSEKDLSQIAKHLFEALRKCDDIGVQYILCQGFEEKGVGVAIMNRLSKAAGYDIIDV